MKQKKIFFKRLKKIPICKGIQFLSVLKKKMDSLAPKINT